MQSLMKSLGIIPLIPSRTDIPNYLQIALRYYRNYENTGQPQALSFYQHYIDVAEEFGFCVVEEQNTSDLDTEDIPKNP